METAAFIGIGIVIGIIGTIGVLLLIDKFTKPAPPLSVDGIFCPNMTMGSGDEKEDFDAQIEFHVLAKTDTMVKIKILHIICNNSKYMTDTTLKKIESLYDNLWISRDRLDFVVDMDTKDRIDTINNIINS